MGFNSTPSACVDSKLDANSYVVISIRQRKFTLADDTIVSTAVDANAIMLRDANMLRMSLVRELRSVADISTVEQKLLAWLGDTRQAR